MLTIIDYKAELQKIASSVQKDPKIDMQEMLKDLEQKLYQYEQFSEICHLSYNRAVIYSSNGLAIQAINLLMERRPFFDQYANYRDLVTIRLATVVILESLGYKKNYYETMHEIYELAQLHNIESAVKDTLNNIGYYFMTMNELTKAEHYLKLCIIKNEEDQVTYNNQTYIRAIINIATLYLQKEDYENMHHYFEKYEQLVYGKGTLFELYFDTLRLKYATHVNDERLIAQCLSNLEQATMEQFESPDVLETFVLMADVYEQQGQLEKAAHMMEKVHEQFDQFHSQVMQQASIFCQYELEKSQLLEDAKIDALTGVYHAKSFMECVENNLTTTNHYWKLLAILDVDYFKQMNDEHGHLVGDQVLKEISKRANHFRKYASDVKMFEFGRYGGDEFYVFLQTETLEALKRYIAQFYEHIITAPFAYEELSFDLSISLGGIFSDLAQPSLTQWLQQADDLLYEMKQAGRGRWKIQGYES